MVFVDGVRSEVALRANLARRLPCWLIDEVAAWWLVQPGRECFASSSAVVSRWKVERPW